MQRKGNMMHLVFLTTTISLFFWKLGGLYQWDTRKGRYLLLTNDYYMFTWSSAWSCEANCNVIVNILNFFKSQIWFQVLMLQWWFNCKIILSLQKSKIYDILIKIFYDFLNYLCFMCCIKFQNRIPLFHFHFWCWVFLYDFI